MIGRARQLLAGCVLLVLAAPHDSAGQQPAPKPLRVGAQLERGPYYVGQSLTLEVSVIAEGERPRVTPPKVAEAEVTPTGTGLRPVSSSGIGAVVFERNVFVSRFRIVPRRAGLLVIPPVQARLGDRSGTSTPIRFPVQKLPESGRTEAFLGGVGSFEVTAQALPATVRMGGLIEYCLKVTGPAARTMTRAPDAQKRIRASSGLKVDSGPVEAIADPPSRAFYYRVRPTRPGDFVLPPISIASFDPDPSVRGYVTKASPGVPIHVVEVERFDPAKLDYAAPAARMSPWVRAGVGVVAGITFVAATATGWLALRRKIAMRRRQGAPGRLLARLAHALDRNGRTPVESARTITEGLAEFLQLTIGRPAGALTPGEAREGITRAFGDDSTGIRAAALVALCDRVQFGGDGHAVEELTGAARRLFTDLRAREVIRGFETPREAVRTAPS